MAQSLGTKLQSNFSAISGVFRVFFRFTVRLSLTWISKTLITLITLITLFFAGWCTRYVRCVSMPHSPRRSVPVCDCNWTTALCSVHDFLPAPLGPRIVFRFRFAVRIKPCFFPVFCIPHNIDLPNYPTYNISRGTGGCSMCFWDPAPCLVLPTRPPLFTRGALQPVWHPCVSWKQTTPPPCWPQFLGRRSWLFYYMTFFDGFFSSTVRDSIGWRIAFSLHKIPRTNSPRPQPQVPSRCCPGTITPHFNYPHMDVLYHRVHLRTSTLHNPSFGRIFHTPPL